MPIANGKIIKCNNCGKELYRSRNSLNTIKNPCCSYKCADDFKRRGKLKFNCSTCGRSFTRSKSNAITKGINKYCSTQCTNKGFEKTQMQDISNQRFNHLVAIKPIYKYVPSGKTHGAWVWLCKCDCGNETKVIISKLRDGFTKSCGCFKDKNLKHGFGPEHGGWRGYQQVSQSFYGRIKNSARIRKIDFNISMEYLWELYIKQNGSCAFTGKKITLPISNRNFRAENNEDRASLDRIDNDKGYRKFTVDL